MWPKTHLAVVRIEHVAERERVEGERGSEREGGSGV